jgi:hypothetical protein
MRTPKAKPCTWADRFQLTVYDSAYLELAHRRALPLATLDSELDIAAKALGIDVIGTRLNDNSAVSRDPFADSWANPMAPPSRPKGSSMQASARGMRRHGFAHFKDFARQWRVREETKYK